MTTGKSRGVAVPGAETPLAEELSMESKVWLGWEGEGEEGGVFIDYAVLVSKDPGLGGAADYQGPAPKELSRELETRRWGSLSDRGSLSCWMLPARSPALPCFML